ncbi:MAG: hypothetical protein KME64_12785 [Scytonematopsis contorta HA4267-MV1]|jgi:hypothetical protein|nr:hypothetical protein [Scytonematopsis contorta HA4267-MV1]
MSGKIFTILSFMLGSLTLLTPANQSADADVKSIIPQQPPAQRQKPPTTKPNPLLHPPYCEYPDSKMFIGPTIEPERIAPGMIIPNTVPPEEISPGMIIPCPKSPNSDTRDTEETREIKKQQVQQ